jgi:hypothetical protein
MVTGLALAGVAYALSAKREGRPLLADGQLDRWKEDLRPRLDRLQEQYGPTIRKMAVAAGFMPGLKLRWRMLAAAMPQIMSALQNATTPATSRHGAVGRRGVR